MQEPLDMLWWHLRAIARLATLDTDCRNLIIEQADNALAIIEGLDNPTPHQKKALDFIKAFHAEHEYMPTYDEIAASLSLNAKSGVHRLIKGLEARGLLIGGIPGCARSMRLPA